MCQSPDIGQNSAGHISNLPTSGQSLISKSCHKSRTQNDTDAKLGPVTKIDKRNRKVSKEFDEEFMSVNHKVIIILPIYGQFEAI